MPIKDIKVGDRVFEEYVDIFDCIKRVKGTVEAVLENGVVEIKCADGMIYKSTVRQLRRFKVKPKPKCWVWISKEDLNRALEREDHEELFLRGYVGPASAPENPKGFVRFASRVLDKDTKGEK